MDDDIFLLEYIKNTSKIINPKIHLYLYSLIKYIFIEPKQSIKSKQIYDRLNNITNKINETIIKKEDKYIEVKDTSKIYSKDNFNNIIYFIKTQNKKYIGEILEGILILIFTKAFKADKTKTFGRYIYNNLSLLKDSNNYELAKWFEKAPTLFRNKELHDIKELLSKDAKIDEVTNEEINVFQENSPFFNLLLEIFKNKYILLSKEYKNNKTMKYINRGIFSQKIGTKIYENLKDNLKTTFEKDLSSNSILLFTSCLYFSQEFGRVRRIPINIMRAFFISVFIYYQNKNSPLMKYIEPINNEKKEEKNDLAYIPFVYNIRGACIEGRFTNIILSPLRIEPRINTINLCQNNLRETGLFEMAKTLLFNKNIKKIEYNKSLLKAYYLDYFNFGIGIFDDYSVEELNLSYNYIKDDSIEFVSKFITHFRGLKTIILSANEFKNGISTFFIILRKLYRKKKINVENLYLNKTYLDDTALYELGELLKCNYCKLKRLYLTMNNKSNCFNFLKKLKINKSLIEIHFNKNNYSNGDINDINRIINKTNIRQLYLFKNKITNFNQCIRIIYRTKLINDKKLVLNNNEKKKKDENKKEEKEDNILIGNSSTLLNLDLSSNEAWIVNKDQINLIYKIIKQMTLSCLDIGHIIYGPYPDRINKDKFKDSFKNAVEDLKKVLEKNKEKYKKMLYDKISYKVDIKKYEDLEKDELFQTINDTFGDFINEKINDKLAIYPVYLKELVYEIIKEIGQNKKYEDIKNQILSKFKSLDNKQLIDKFIDYMILKRAQKKVINIYQQLKGKQLIII